MTDPFNRSLEYWDQTRKKWVLYRSDLEQKEDCERYPYDSVPCAIFLDTSVINLLVKFENCVFQMEPIPETLHLNRAHNIEALMHLIHVGARANWVWTTSSRALDEVLCTSERTLREQLADYVAELLSVYSDQRAHSTDLGRRSIDASFLRPLTGKADRELLGNAIGLGCDTFCTTDIRTIVRHREKIENLPIRIMTPVEWWNHFKPWSGLVL